MPRSPPQGAAATDVTGSSVSSAGDINGDGFDDYIIGAALSDAADYNAGAAYVTFGRGSGFAAINLATLNASTGFRIIGENDSDQAGAAISSAGDINGDGYDDILVGAHGNDNGATISTGAAYVLYGKAAGFGNIDLGALNAADGFKIQGAFQTDQVGRSVASIGDVNGDHIDDIIIGANFSNAGAGRSGAAYVVFGKTTGLGPINSPRSPRPTDSSSRGRLVPITPVAVFLRRATSTATASTTFSSGPMATAATGLAPMAPPM